MQPHEERGLMSGLLSAAASHGDLKCLREYVLSMQANGPESARNLELIWPGIVATAPIQLPTLETLLDPMFEA